MANNITTTPNTAIGASYTRPITTGNKVNDDGDEECETPLVKKRRTKNYAWREDMAKKTCAAIVTRTSSLEPTTFNSWGEFIEAWDQYMAQTKTLYRRRSSSSTSSWNNKNRFKKYPVPDSFQYATMAYWCTHGCIQPSRSTGVRAHLHNRFTGCTARVTADVVYEKGDDNELRWFIRVRNQITQHNHYISDEIYNCYINNSSVPDELLLGAVDESSEQTRRRAQEKQQLANRRARSQSQPSTLSTNSGHITDGALLHSQDMSTIANEAQSFVAAAMEASAHSSLSAFNQGHAALLQEVLADEQKMNMSKSELQPLLEALRQTPSRVIHKRLQDVSEMVLQLLSKWHEDRIQEEPSLQPQTNNIPVHPHNPAELEITRKTDNNDTRSADQINV